MNALFKIRNPITGLVLAGIVVASLSPAVSADPGRRYKGVGGGHGPGPVARRVYVAPRRAVYVRHSDAAPLIAGLIGGFVLGNVIAHASDPYYSYPAPACPPPPSYFYWDPYCQERFGSLESYRSHLYGHPHPGIARMIDRESGDCVRTYRWDEGGWRSWDDGRDGQQDRGWSEDDNRDWNGNR
jgi:hypothetical protein